jgi:hypothetical protein
MSSLSERDIKIQKLKNVIENRNKLLREIYTSIRNSTEENRYLKGVVRDYTNYYANMKKQKEKQLEGLIKLEHYIDTILQKNSNNQSSSVLRQAQEDKKEIVREIKKIKREIDDM